MSHLLLLFAATVLFLINACNPVVDPGAPEFASTVRTTHTNRVIDEAGTSVAGALVKGHGKTTTTNNNGVFVLNDVVVPSTRAVVIVSTGGYFTGARAAYPSASKITTMPLTLQQAKQMRTISPVSGGQVAVGVETMVLSSNS
jgi:hypothetical protein